VTPGPRTNLAGALVRDRALLTRFRHVYCMSGAADGVGNISATAEYNVWADPEAAAIVLGAATPDRVTLIGWDVSRRDAVMTTEDQQRLRAIGTPLAVFADEINRAVGDWMLANAGVAGYDRPDPVAMAVALRPDPVTESEEVTASIALSDETRGQLLIDRRAIAAPPNVTVVRHADETAFKTLLFTACAAPAAPAPVADMVR
jgi:purine nucleosidase